jgi:hypothetical protein
MHSKFESMCQHLTFITKVEGKKGKVLDIPIRHNNSNSSCHPVENKHYANRWL